MNENEIRIGELHTDLDELYAELKARREEFSIFLGQCVDYANSKRDFDELALQRSIKSWNFEEGRGRFSGQDRTGAVEIIQTTHGIIKIYLHPPKGCEIVFSK